MGRSPQGSVLERIVAVSGGRARVWLPTESNPAAPSSPSPFGLALFGESLGAFDGVLTVAMRDIGRIAHVLHAHFEDRIVERAHHDLLGRANAHRRALEDHIRPAPR